MAVDLDGRWQADICEKQREGLAACLPSRQNVVLFNGPRWSGKTIDCHHAACQHSYITDRANICVLSLTQSVGIDSGVWQHLTELFLPEWINGEFGMEWAKKPCIMNVTKKPYCEVTNRHGTVSRISLESLKNEDEVEARFKSRSYSMIWINELTKWKNRKTFDTLKQCLRMPHLKPEEHLFLADTNPCLVLGKESPWYHLWYDLRSSDDAELHKFVPEGENPDKIKPLRDSLRVIEFTIDDNTYITQEKKAALYSEFCHDPDLLAAYYYGQWVTASVDAIFHKVFRPLYHVVGELETPANSDPDMLCPEPTCMELFGGWDPGSTTNWAFGLAEKFFLDDAQVEKDLKTLYKGKPLFKALDEHVVVNEDVDVYEFVEAVIEKMMFWQNWVERLYKRRVLWRHWSDRSVLDMRDLQTGKIYQEIIFDVSSEIGLPIFLDAAARGRGSVESGVDLMRRLFWEDRFFINRARCPHAIQTFKSIRKGKANQVIAKGDRHKHSLDSWRYIVQTECADELRRKVMSNLKKQREAESEASVISVPI